MPIRLWCGYTGLSTKSQKQFSVVRTQCFRCPFMQKELLSLAVWTTHSASFSFVWNFLPELRPSPSKGVRGEGRIRFGTNQNSRVVKLPRCVTQRDIKSVHSKRRALRQEIRTLPITASSSTAVRDVGD